MFLLDTDIVSLLLHYTGQQPMLERRVLGTPPQDLWVSVVTVEEMVQGALARIRLDQQRRRGTGGYAFLGRLVPSLAVFQILPYDDDADRLFQAMPAQVRRIGANDCRIAASALSRGMTVVTRNATHFARIPGVPSVDWTR